MERSVRKYTQEFRQEAVKLALQKPSVSDAAKSLGIPTATLHSWVNSLKRQSKVNNVSATDVDMSAILAKNRRLNKELAILKEEKEILKKAAAYFARDQK